MKTKTLLFILFSVTLFAMATFITVIFNAAPTTRAVVALFYTSLIISLSGLLFLSLSLRSYLAHHLTPPWQETVRNMRWSILLALYVATFLILQSYRVLNIATAIVLTVAVILANTYWQKRVLAK